MIDALFNQTNYVAAKSMLDATVLRQQAIASNIANVETPGYKRLQVAKSFEAEFERAIGTKDMESIRGLRPTLEVDASALPSKRDGNTVLTITMSCATRADRDTLLRARVDAGTVQTLDNLHKHLATHRGT